MELRKLLPLISNVIFISKNRLNNVKELVYRMGQRATMSTNNPKENDVQAVFLVGVKSLGAYGGYETFINKLTEYHADNKSIR